jgi:sporulation integral membrane protein YtvI
VLAAFLISARLPQLRSAIKTRLPENWNGKYLPTLRRVRGSPWGWLKAQIKLSALTWGIVAVGFLLLQIPYGPAWAAVVALVDAVPVLGTGTVLVPWSFVCFLQGQSLRGIGILCTYGAAMLTRTVLEPRLVGRHLGLDPLATLVALYVGYRFWGILGLLLTPILAAAAKNLVVTSDS